VDLYCRVRCLACMEMLQELYVIRRWSVDNWSQSIIVTKNILQSHDLGDILLYPISHEIKQRDGYITYIPQIYMVQSRLGKVLCELVLFNDQVYI
jgi:hypothetical protein